MKQNPSPEKLLPRIAEHNEHALGELYDLYAPALLAMLMRVLNDRAAAEDVLEDVFVRTWSETRRLAREQAGVGAALFLAARAKAIERRRAEQRLPSRARALPDRKIPAWMPRPGEISLLDDRMELLRKVVSQLPMPQRRLLDLAVFEGLTEEEIAHKLGEPQARVKSGLQAAMRFLRHRLAAVLGTWAANI